MILKEQSSINPLARLNRDLCRWAYLSWNLLEWHRDAVKLDTQYVPYENTFKVNGGLKIREFP